MEHKFNKIIDIYGFEHIVAIPNWWCMATDMNKGKIVVELDTISGKRIITDKINEMMTPVVDNDLSDPIREARIAIGHKGTYLLWDDRNFNANSYYIYNWSLKGLRQHEAKTKPQKTSTVDEGWTNGLYLTIKVGCSWQSSDDLPNVMLKGHTKRSEQPISDLLENIVPLTKRTYLATSSSARYILIDDPIDIVERLKRFNGLY